MTKDIPVRPWPAREKAFDVACWFAGKAGRALGFRLAQPCFVIGTGRCGTTLLVRILDSNPELTGFPGEANELWHPKLEPFETAMLRVPPIEADPKRFTEISVANWPARHGETIRSVFTGFMLIFGPSKAFFAKSAMISFMIPQILGVFPDAKFIHIYRSGPSVVESYVKKNFGKYSHYSPTRKDYRVTCAAYWNACILEIEQRKDDLSLERKGQFLEFSYEHLCQRPQAIIADIASFLGVSAAGFRFDCAAITSQNYKADNFANDPERTDLLGVMFPGMKLKGYLPDCLSV